MVFPHWRGVMGPPGMTAEQIKYWDDALSRIAKSPTFVKTMESMNQQVTYKSSLEFRRFLADQNATLAPLVEQLGLKKAQ